MVEEFPSNSQHRIRESPQKMTPKVAPKTEPEKQIKRITTGEVVRRKKPLGTRFKDVFFGGDAKGVWGYVTMDVLIPAAKDMIADATTQAVERMVFGEARGRGRYGRPGSSSHTPYNRAYASTRPSTPPWSADRQEPRRDMSPSARAMHNFDDIVLESRGEAEMVIDQLMEILSRYNVASVSDLYSMVGIQPTYTDNKYGWSDLRGANVSHIRGGYLLNLPKPEPLD